MPENPWSGLPRQAAVIGRLAVEVAADERLRWLEVCCSLAAGRGDEWSDVDAAIGYARELEPEDLEGVGTSIVEGAGRPTDVLRHVMPGGPVEAPRFAVEYENSVQLDLMLMPAARRPGLPTGSVAVVDKDGRLSAAWQPPVEHEPTPAVAREWLMLGWWALGDVAKYLHRESLLEAVERLTEARQQALRLHAAAEGVAFPSFGLVSLLNFPPFLLPPTLMDTYALPSDRRGIAKAAKAVGVLLDEAAERLSGRLNAAVASSWSKTMSQRLETAAMPC